MARLPPQGEAKEQGQVLDAAELHLAVLAVRLMKQQHGMWRQPARTSGLCSKIQRPKSMKTREHPGPNSDFHTGDSQFCVSKHRQLEKVNKTDLNLQGKTEG